jgi:galactoside O-acetyltransferase
MKTIFKLILFEIVNFFHFILYSIPGKTGSLFRWKYLKFRFNNVGVGRSSFEREISITGYENINIGSHCTFSKGCFIMAHSDGNIEIGDNFSMIVNSYLGAADGGCIKIGNNVLIAQNVVLRASNHCFIDISVPINLQGHTVGKIFIEDDCWIGANVVVTPNVKIGKHSIVGAGAVVTNDIEPYSIVAGVPAKLIRKRI